MIIKITEKYKNWRLDKFLTEKITFISRSQIQKQIEQKNVLVNKQKISKHYFLNPEDIVEINFDINNKKNNFEIKANKNIKLDTVFSDENYLVVNKQANLIVHPGNIHKENDTLINGVLAKHPKIKNIGEDKLRPGIVHRLDKNVSGLMVIAKTQAAFLDLKKQFINRKIYKEYIALVHGVVEKEHDFIKFNIARSKSSGNKMAARPDDSGKTAITEYDVIKQYSNYCLLKIIIHTGRTHQIRVHLNAIKHPIVGDNVYKPRSLKTNLKPNRIFLHSHILKFKNLEKKLLEFEQPLPSSLDNILEKIN